MSQAHVVIVGGGTGGISVAARLSNLADPPRITLIEPSETHYYQPLWTLVGGGVFQKEDTARPQIDYIPSGVEWVKERVARFDPETNTVILASGASITYDALVVAAGIHIKWEAIEGLQEALGRGGVCSNYSYETVDYTWEVLRNLEQGRAIFTFPSNPIKCAGAPQKIMWLTEHHLRLNNRREKVEVVYAAASAGIFGVQRYARTLQRLATERGVVTEYRRELVAIRAKEKIAVFKNLDTGAMVEESYTMLHVTPPQGPPPFIQTSPLASEAGWVDVDKYSLQHVRYPNVFSLGDCSSLPTSRTGAAIRKQAPVLVENLAAFLGKRPLRARYDGYASCPLVTGYGRLILAEFDYDGRPAESFSFDQSQERYSMYALKAYGLPEMYWNGMLRGLA